MYVNISKINNKSNKIMAQFSNRKRASGEKEVLKLKSELNNNYLPKWRWLVVFLPSPRSGEVYFHH